MDRTEAWYLSKYCNPAIGKVDEMVKPDTSQINVNYYYFSSTLQKNVILNT